MILSLSLIFLVGLSMASICEKIKLPRIIGMLFTGVLLGPFVLDVLDPSILGISAELRQIALVIILIKAGLSLQIEDLKKVGRPAVLLSFLPALFEIGAFVWLAPMILHCTRLEGAIVGAVLGAVSPAVVVPKMVMLTEKKYGTEKKIPQMILAGASLDDVFVIVLFSTFLNMAQGEKADVRAFLNVPISIVLGILGGALVGLLLALFFEWRYKQKNHIRNSTKVILVLGMAFLFLAVESFLEPYVAFSGLLAVMSMACLLGRKSPKGVSLRLSQKFGKLWLAAEVILFVMVGAAVDIRYTLGASLGALLMLCIGLLFRSLGVYLCLAKTGLTAKEKLFCILSYLPKATVQAAIGGVPLSLGLPCGKLVLSIAVLSILVTAPLGAFLMDVTYPKLLTKEPETQENAG